jgi:hypothetical protein
VNASGDQTPRTRPAQPGQPGQNRRDPWIAGLTMAALAAVCAVISYNDGLLLIRLAGAVGRVAYLYPLLPDGLIVISTAAMYEAARAGIRRPRWAIAGIVLGAGLTVAMNAAAGAVQSWLFALADLFVPVVFFVALEILIWLIRRGRGGGSQAVTPATPGHCPHQVALTREDAVRVAYGHARDCLDEPVSIRQLAATFRMTRDRVAELARPVPSEPPRAAPPAALGAGVAGAVTDSQPAPATLNGQAR